MAYWKTEVQCPVPHHSNSGRATSACSKCLQVSAQPRPPASFKFACGPCSPYGTYVPCLPKCFPCSPYRIICMPTCPPCTSRVYRC